MMNHEVVRLKQQLDDLFKYAEDVSDEDPKQLSHWGKYLCVLTSGFIEEATRLIFTDYTETKSSSKPVKAFVSSKLKRCINLNTENLLQVVGAFSSDWREQLEIETEGERKEAIDSIVKNRHKIAHGKSSNISFAEVKKYYKKVVEVLELMEIQCLT